MEEEQEPKQPCKTCGPTNWNPQQTRRNLFKTAAIAGLSIATAGTFLTTSVQSAYAEPAPFSLSACKQRAYDEYEDCCQVVGASGNSKIWMAIVGYPACWTEYEFQLLACEATEVEEVAAAAAQWLSDHASELAQLVGEAIVIAGVVLVLVVLGSSFGLVPV